MKLNLGAGSIEIEGYKNLDRKYGQEIYPLPYADGTIEDIRASHVLEHFSHTQIGSVLSEWVRTLSPGGSLRVAVPDFEWSVQQYLAGANIPIQGYVMGGHVNADDHHGTIFDFSALYDAMKASGLVGIEYWKSEVKDCAALPVSLNLMGYKPPETWPKVAAVMSTPRLGFMDNYFCGYQLPQLGIQLRKHTGAFWGQCFTRAIQESLQDIPEYILTLDYDTIFTKDDVQSLLLTMMQHPEIDALAPIQASRTKSTPLFTIKRDGKNISEVPLDEFKELTTRINTAHFGLTVLRASNLRELEKPWFCSIPDENGEWGENRTDADIHFWRQWEKSGFNLHLANRVSVGHAEMMIRWPGADLQSFYQHPSEFWDTGKPMEVWK